MKLTDFLTVENVRQGVELSSKKRALELVGALVAEHLNRQYACENEDGLCPIACFANLFKREKLGSTGINQGIALPHAKLPSNSHVQLDKPIAVFLQLAEPIDYEASDNKEVDLIYAVLFPETCCAEYKNYLPDIAQKLSDKHLQKVLRAADNPEDIWQILHNTDQQSETEQ